MRAIHLLVLPTFFCLAGSNKRYIRLTGGSVKYVGDQSKEPKKISEITTQIKSVHFIYKFMEK